MRIGPGAHLEIGPTARMIIGPGFYARRDFTLYVQGTLEVGPGLFCNRGVVLGAADHVKIGEAVRIGERCSILDGNHVIEPLSDVRARFEDYEMAPITIGDRVLISANSVILPGADIGSDSVIAAGAVVRGTIPPGVLAAGAPAVVKRTLTP
jgi:acetyltransferase-like isoleucine patch superfamily enzyme